MTELSDRELKERVTGAVVLVIFAVLIVPVFLDGEGGEPQTVRQAVTLPGQTEDDRQQQTIVLRRERSEPVPSASVDIQEAPPAQAQQIVAAPMPAESGDEEMVAAAVDAQPASPDPGGKPEAEPEPVAAGNKSSTGMWAVQLGSFSNEENAKQLAADLRNQGYAAFLSQWQTDGGRVQRVRIGPQKDRASAEEIAAQLARSGHRGRVVPHP